MDKQARVALAEHVVYCRRLDKITIPFIGAIYSLMTGSKLPLPKVHVGIVKYGDSPQSMTVERWTYTGRDLYQAYDTKQAFSDSYEHSSYSYLPPFLSHGRYATKRDSRFYMTLTKIYFRKYSRVLCFIFGVLLAFLYSFITRADTPVIIEQQASQQVNTQKYNISEFKIISSYRLLNKVSFVFMDSKRINIHLRI